MKNFELTPNDPNAPRRTFAFTVTGFMREDDWGVVENCPDEGFAATYVANEMFWENPRSPNNLAFNVKIKNEMNVVETFFVRVSANFNYQCDRIPKEFGDMNLAPNLRNLNAKRPTLIKK